MAYEREEYREKISPFVAGVTGLVVGVLGTIGAIYFSKSENREKVSRGLNEFSGEAKKRFEELSQRVSRVQGEMDRRKESFSHELDRKAGEAETEMSNLKERTKKL